MYQQLARYASIDVAEAMLKEHKSSVEAEILSAEQIGDGTSFVMYEETYQYGYHCDRYGAIFRVADTVTLLKITSSDDDGVSKTYIVDRAKDLAENMQSVVVTK